MSTIEPRKPSRFVRCPDCHAIVANTEDERDLHVDWHDTLDKRFDDIEANTKSGLRVIGNEIDGLRQQLRDAPAAPEGSEDDLVGDWPDLDTTEDAGLAAVLTSDPTEAPDDDLEDPTSDPDEPAVATVFGAPVTYGQTGVIA